MGDMSPKNGTLVARFLAPVAALHDMEKQMDSQKKLLANRRIPNALVQYRRSKIYIF